MSVPERLQSRKLWIAVGAFITLAANSQWTEAVAVVLGYLGIQGLTDHKQASASQNYYVDSVVGAQLDYVDDEYEEEEDIGGIQAIFGPAYHDKLATPDIFRFQATSGSST